MAKARSRSLEQQTLAQIDKDRIFNSPTWGKMTFKEVIFRLGAFMHESPDDIYKVIIGSDSQGYTGGVAFVTAIIVHRMGGGAIYFWQKILDTTNHWVLKTRMYEEAILSMTLAQQFMEQFTIEGIFSFNVEIHVDIGETGKTRELIGEVVGMVKGSGFDVKIKPEAYGAASVADRYT